MFSLIHFLQWLPIQVAIALPTEQVPLQNRVSKNVQIVRDEYVSNMDPQVQS